MLTWIKALSRAVLHRLDVDRCRTCGSMTGADSVMTNPSDVMRARLILEPELAREAVAAALFDAGSQGIHEDGELLVTQFQSDDETRVAREVALAAEQQLELSPAEALAEAATQIRTQIEEGS